MQPRIGSHYIYPNDEVRFLNGELIADSIDIDDLTNFICFAEFIVERYKEEIDKNEIEEIDLYSVCSLIGAFALTHRKFLNRAAEIIDIEVIRK